jgi:N-acetylmuramic acid 6-phosphate etherase
MSRGRSQTGGQGCLGIEGGGTHTVALLADTNDRIIQRLTFGPLNLKLASDRQLLAVLRRCRSSLFPPPSSVALCLAGCRTPADRARVRALVRRVWPRAQVFAGNDLDSGLAAAFGPRGAGLLVISGTGSVVCGRAAGGRTARAGGWGHLLGDHGSGYRLALDALRAALRDYDRTGRTGRALRRALHRLCLNSPEHLPAWIHQASKADVAALLPDLIGHDPDLLRQHAAELAADCAAVARKLRLIAPAIALAGGVFRHRPPFRRATIRAIHAVLPKARIRLLQIETVNGALLLALREADVVSSQSKRSASRQRNVRIAGKQSRSH